MEALRRARIVRWSIGGALVAMALWALFRSVAPMSVPALCDALARGRVTQVFAAQDVTLRCEGVRVERLDAELQRALTDDAATALPSLLRARKGSALAIVPGASMPGGVGKRLAALGFEPGLRAVALAPELALYAPTRELALSSEERDALAYVARALFRGAREPSIASFPAALRRVERVEVMVMLSIGGEPRLWRSARGTSIARALLTAARVARDRWREREQAMGGPLAKRLLELDVEVAVLSEDGTLLSSQSTFVDRAVTRDHGVGFDYRTAWHYVLPRDVARRQGHASQALAAQITEQGLTPDILGQSDTRVYRFALLPLGISRAPSAGVPAASP